MKKPKKQAKRKKLRLRKKPNKAPKNVQKSVKDTSQLIICNLELVLEVDELKQIIDNKDKEILRLQSLLSNA